MDVQDFTLIDAGQITESVHFCHKAELGSKTLSDSDGSFSKWICKILRLLNLPTSHGYGTDCTKFIFAWKNMGSVHFCDEARHQGTHK